MLDQILRDRANGLSPHPVPEDDPMYLMPQ